MEISRVMKDGLRLRILIDEYADNPREFDNIGTMVCGHREYSLGDREASNMQDYVSWDDWLSGEILKNAEEELIVLPLYLYDHSGLRMNTVGFSCPWDSGQVGWIYASKKIFKKETSYTDEELFGTNAHRQPVIKEHVKVKGWNDWAQVCDIDERGVLVDFDYCKAKKYRKEDHMFVVPMTEITEVMVNRAEQMLINEVSEYDSYISGNVFRYEIDRITVCECCGSTLITEEVSCGGFLGEDIKGQMMQDVGEQYTELFEILD